ncbi:hypothetical protein ATN83_p20091 (plasmid) [Raoultella ornithinolytica]|uniref:Uncharacterized protein n=1 Tax=Klebsiella pneumoniae TaxID=573 RepID=A0A2S1JFT1_KLEPN|nr:hypothetical protein ATN83_p20091 [Raoultella ornithinolytica]AWF77193.1 hypothetical protein [Klebsiella pneumoniae]AWF78630.1 hypothetical protein [Klebsiella pneumoniae]QIQ11339.1 hypothetical protein [Klebsiella pneumoniae]
MPAKCRHLDLKAIFTGTGVKGKTKKSNHIMLALYGSLDV